jgi:hypothetical protein
MLKDVLFETRSLRTVHVVLEYCVSDAFVSYSLS